MVNLLSTSSHFSSPSPQHTLNCWPLLLLTDTFPCPHCSLQFFIPFSLSSYGTHPGSTPSLPPECQGLISTRYSSTQFCLHRHLATYLLPTLQVKQHLPGNVSHGSLTSKTSLAHLLCIHAIAPAYYSCSIALSI